MEDLQNTSEKTDNPAKMAKRKSYINQLIFIALIIFTISVSGFYFYRYYLHDYLTYDQPLKNLKGHRTRVSSIAFSPDGKTIVSGSYDNTMKLWDASNGNLIHDLSGHEDVVRMVAFSPDGKTVASGSNDHTIRVYDVETGKLLYDKEFSGDVLSLAFSPDGQSLAVATVGIYLLNAKDGEKKYWIATDNFYVVSVAFSPDGKTLVGCFRAETKLWDAENGNLKQTFAQSSGAARPLIFSQDGKTLVGGSLNGKIFIWDVADGKLKNTLSANKNNVPVAIFPNGKILVSGGDEDSKETKNYEGEIEFWDIENGNLVRKFAKQRSPVNSLAISPDGKTLAAGNYNGTIGLWKVE